MKLSELKRLAVKKQIQVRFRLPDGQDGLVTSHGVAQVPALATVPTFHLEDVIKSTESFVINHLQTGKSQHATRAEVEKMIAALSPAAASAAHDDE